MIGKENDRVEHMKRIAVTVKLSRMEELDQLDSTLSTINSKISLFEVYLVDKDLVNSVGISDILDPFEDQGLRIASIKAPFTKDLGILEKLAIISSETWGKTIVLKEKSPSADFLPELFDLFSVYKTKLLFNSPPQLIQEIYEKIRGYIGGVFGLAIDFTYFKGENDSISLLDSYLGLIKSISITNHDEDMKPIPILDPRGNNNPRLLRYLVEKNYDGLLTIDSYNFYGEKIIGEYEAVKQYIRSLLEKHL